MSATASAQLPIKSGVPGAISAHKEFLYNPSARQESLLGGAPLKSTRNIRFFLPSRWCYDTLRWGRSATVDHRIAMRTPMPPRILIVDDSLQVRNVMRKIFESEPGWQVCGEASNGKEGIEIAQQIHPNLIILDLSMPVMNGLEAARILNASMPGVPLVMFTSFSTHVLEEQALAAGIRKLIVKSGSLSELVGCVRGLTKNAA